MKKQTLVFRNAVIIDGSRRRAFLGHLLVEDDAIVDIIQSGELRHGEDAADAAARLKATPQSTESNWEPPLDSTVIDASGTIVTPGFIDIHTHSDLSIFAAPDASSKVLQGVTTDVVGNCSIGPAPITQSVREYFNRWRRHEVEWLQNAGVVWPEWRTWGMYAQALDRQERNLNVAGLVAHGPVRAAVMGLAEAPPNAEQLRQMEYLVVEAMEAGAFGLSTGLIYTPSRYGTTAEITALARAMAPYGGFYATHIRGEDHRLMPALDEAIQIGWEAGVPVQISHHKAKGRKNWGAVVKGLARMNQARAEGLDITTDVYPYTYGGNFPLAPQRVLPAEAPRAEEGRKALEMWLRNHAGIANDPLGIDTTGPELAWDEVFVVEHPNVELVGLSIHRAAAVEGMDPIEWFLRYMGNKQVKVKNIFMSETDVRTVLTYPHAMVGSDTYVMNTTPVFAGSWLHPRNFGTFARTLQTYVRELGLLSWEDAIFKLTGFPAARLGLKDRGLLQPGMKADITAWSPQELEERATIGQPFAYAQGVRWVLVNGQVTVREGRMTGVRSGVLIRRQ